MDDAPLPVPASEDELIDMVAAIFDGQTPGKTVQLFDVFRERLMAGDLTPREIRTRLEDAA